MDSREEHAMSNAIHMGDTVEGIYGRGETYDETFVGVVDGYSPGGSTVLLTSPVVRRDGSVRYDVGETIWLNSWQSVDVRVIARSVVMPEVRHEQGHFWIGGQHA